MEEKLKQRIAELEKVMERVARLNCFRPMPGKFQHHYKDPDCGQCTSCLARKVMKNV